VSAGEKFVAVLGSSTKGILQVNQRDIKIKLYQLFFLSSICRMSACRFVAQTATFCDMFQSCRRNKKMSCWQGVQNNTTFDDMSGDSRHVGNFVIVV